MKKKDKYKIYEQYGKFYIEKLERFLLWTYYSPVQESRHYESPLYYHTLEEARKYVNDSEKKYHSI